MSKNSQIPESPVRGISGFPKCVCFVLLFSERTVWDTMCNIFFWGSILTQLTPGHILFYFKTFFLLVSWSTKKYFKKKSLRKMHYLWKKPIISLFYKNFLMYHFQNISRPWGIIQSCPDFHLNVLYCKLNKMLEIIF